MESRIEKSYDPATHSYTNRKFSSCVELVVVPAISVSINCRSTQHIDALLGQLCSWWVSDFKMIECFKVPEYYNHTCNYGYRIVILASFLGLRGLKSIQDTNPARYSEYIRDNPPLTTQEVLSSLQDYVRWEGNKYPETGKQGVKWGFLLLHLACR